MLQNAVLCGNGLKVERVKSKLKLNLQLSVISLAYLNSLDFTRLGVSKTHTEFICNDTISCTVLRYLTLNTSSSAWHKMSCRLIKTDLYGYNIFAQF